jgi:clan AA aspartic protease (TIGR02281 family)
MFEIFQRQLLIFMFSIVLVMPLDVAADHEIFYKGAHSGKAWFDVNGRSHTIRKGQTSKGITVISLKDSEVVIEVHGERYLYKKKSKIGKKLQVEVEIPYYSTYSAYIIDGYVNGEKFTFIVDTGAYRVALNLNDAKRLKIKLKSRDKTKVTLAGGKVVDAWETILRSVKVGDIEIHDVSAVIIKQTGNEPVLLGMSFLSQVEISQSNNLMTLKKITH